MPFAAPPAAFFFLEAGPTATAAFSRLRLFASAWLAPVACSHVSENNCHAARSAVDKTQLASLPLMLCVDQQWICSTVQASTDSETAQGPTQSINWLPMEAASR